MDSSPSRTCHWDNTNWDLDPQQPHGGREWSPLEALVEDFSVTTNLLGPPWRATAAAGAALQQVDHYPAANCEPAVTDLAGFIDPDDPGNIHACLALGNGASELIDLVTRVGTHPGNFFIPDSAQMEEYERAALASGRARIDDPNRSSFTMLAVVNPCNPSGDYKPVGELKAYIEGIVLPGTTVFVDESMQVFIGPGWRDDSLVRQRQWARKLVEEKDIHVYVVHSWTKVWSCPGIRLGSILAPVAQDIVQIKHHQVPWSVNICALAFLSAAVKDREYLQHTWEMTPRWRQHMVDRIVALHPDWKVHGMPFLSWIWVDTGSDEAALAAVARAREAGCPIRDGKTGYEMPTFVRIAVRDPLKSEVLLKALEF